MKTVYILFFICLFSYPSFSQWEPQNSGIINNLRGIFFINETTGFAVGESFPPNEAPILKTTDGGATWIVKSSGNPNSLRDIAFNTNSKGFACGLYGTLLKSTDAGETWKDETLEMEESFRAIDFPSKDTGYVAGENGVFLKTIDSGVNWDSLNTGITQDLLNIQFLNNDTGYATGSVGFSNGIIIRTQDGGVSWQTVYTSSQAIPALAITKNNKVFAGGGTSPSGGNEFIIRSTDGGDTWEQVYTGPSGYSIRECTFSSNMVGWFVNDAGSVIRTKDGGDTWSVNHVSSSGLNSIFFTEEDTGYAVGALGSIFKYIPCSIPLDPLGSITGETTICNGATATYSISPVEDANSYSWIVPPDASIIYIQGDTLIAVTFGVTSGSIEVIAGADCDTSVSALPVSVIPSLITNVINGDTTFCAGDTGIYYISPVEGATVYNWSVPPDASIVFQNDTMIVVAMGDTSGIIQVTVSNNCDTAVATLAVTFRTLLPPVSEIVGDTVVCKGGIASYYVPPVSGAVSYYWSIPSDASIIYVQGDTLIVVQFDSNSGAIEVTVNGLCDSVKTSFAIEVTGEFSPIDTIYGNTSACENDTLIYFISPVEGATDYVWTLPAGANIVSGQGDTLIEVFFGSASGSVEVSAGTGDCNAATGSLAITVTPSLSTADEIIGVTSLCSGDIALFIVSSIPGADSYFWQVPEEATLLSGQGDTLITVLFGDSSGNVIFSASSTCETVTSELYVTVHPGLPTFTGIIGDTALCIGDTGTYYINPVEGVVYSWVIPFDATLISTQSDTLITVVFEESSNEVTVVAGSACEIADTSITVNVYPGLPPLTGIIGDTALCVGDTGTYFINPAEGVVYSWVIPFDAAIISAQSDTLITVVFGAFSNEVTVLAGNDCEIAETSMMVTVNPYPPVPVISFVDNNLVSSEATGNQWYYNEVAIPGATEQILTPTVNGTYSVIVTYPPGCSTASDSFEVISVGIDVITPKTTVIVFPNPFEFSTTLHLTNNFQLQNGRLEIRDVQGRIVETIDHLSGNSVKISRELLPDGIYFFQLSNEEDNLLATGKLVIQ